MTIPAEDTRTSPADVLRAAAARGWTLATAESCTGGMIAAAITSVPGSSASFLGGVVAYSDAVKQRILGVSAETLAANGAVSAETAVEMATGARATLGADVAVAVTGVAGPGGGTERTPVGSVWFGIDGPFGARSEHRRFDGDRAAVREGATRVALALMHRYLDGATTPPTPE